MRQDSFWRVVHQKALPFGLAALTAILIASVPLIAGTQREAAEYRIGRLRWEILGLQERKAQLLKQLADRLTVKGLEELGTQAGLQPPDSIVHIEPSLIPNPTPGSAP